MDATSPFQGGTYFQTSFQYLAPNSNSPVLVKVLEARILRIIERSLATIHKIVITNLDSGPSEEHQRRQIRTPPEIKPNSLEFTILAYY